LYWPPQAGATSYQAVRSTTPTFDAGCTGIVTDDTRWTDTDVPAPGGVFYYLHRAFEPNPGSWGTDSTGTERTGDCL
jgi:hypothetical protein